MSITPIVSRLQWPRSAWPQTESRSRFALDDTSPVPQPFGKTRLEILLFKPPQRTLSQHFIAAKAPGLLLRAQPPLAVERHAAVLVQQKYSIKEKEPIFRRFLFHLPQDNLKKQ
ncbi:hypothetical protein [Flavobacterium sp. JP2137]|uniref:hypothetical protein n=1 Tax=Flavobacterium sp. JP2137 TaxID=3414510 RepID=UPI003D2FAD7E